ncbi:hypothetical protein PsorP6_017287 [Peronosclerospora sorghi]|uniref:Uncharacterized protein n=1 Tax=Peronosclerospora sorghi TaxID=230839 RepID=A0ACC0WNZ4_9STRA|nr:hypothetical protein PsorP6_017287 [Peronosclerospora sorghi]
MCAMLGEQFELPRLSVPVDRFLQTIYFAHVKGGAIQREWDTVDGYIWDTRMHLDYLYLGDSNGDSKYVLVLKDELTHYCELVDTDLPTSLTAARLCTTSTSALGWASDNGSHVKAVLLTELVNRVQTCQCLIPFYTPPINVNLNHTPAPSLGAYAPSGRSPVCPRPRPLDIVVVPGEGHNSVLPVNLDTAEPQLSTLH